MTLALTALAVTLAPAAASAAPPTNPRGCYVHGDFGVWYADNIITVFNKTSCSGTTLVQGKVARIAGNKIRIQALDEECDNRGITVSVHGYNVSSGGCGETGKKEVSLSSVAQPHNFWIRFSNQFTSYAINF